MTSIQIVASDFIPDDAADAMLCPDASKFQLDLNQSGNTVTHYTIYTIRSAVMTITKYWLPSQCDCLIRGSSAGYGLVWIRRSEPKSGKQRYPLFKSEIECWRGRSQTFSRQIQGFDKKLLLITAGDQIFIRQKQKNARPASLCYVITFQAAYLNSLSLHLIQQNVDEISGEAKAWPGLASIIKKIEQEYQSKLPGLAFMLNNMSTQLAIESIRALHQQINDQESSRHGGLPVHDTNLSFLNYRSDDQFLKNCETDACYQDTSSKRDKMRQIANEIRSSCASDIRVSSLAARYQMHPSYLCRCFRSVYQKTILTYRTECRIDLACQLLLKDHLSVTQIAGLCGYQSASRFSEQFKVITGLVPTQYRKNLFSKQKINLHQ